jgi:ribosome-associated protein
MQTSTQGRTRGTTAGAPVKTRKRFPVRGALRSGVSDRAVLAPAPQASRGDISEIRALAIAAIDAALDKKALAPVLIDVSAMSSYTDFIGIVSGRSDRQVDAIAENVRQVMKGNGRFTIGQEGAGNGRWTLLDFGSIVIHVFHHPVREFYDLESLWIEAPRVALAIPAEATISEPDAYYGGI